MKNRVWLGGVVLALSLPVAAMAASSAPAPAAGAESPAEKIPLIGVNVLMGTPSRYQGLVRVRGVVSSVFPKEQRLGLLDTIYMNCCSSPCGSLQLLPVKWTGDMPAVKSLVIAEGQILRTGGKLEFVARSIERITAAEETRK